MPRKRKKEININCTDKDFGLRVECEGKDYFLKYPKEIWRKYPNETKEVLIDNLIHLLTIDIPVVASKVDTIKYNTSMPLFRSFFQHIVFYGIPPSIDDYKEETQTILKRSLNSRYLFKDSEVKRPSYEKIQTKEKALISISCGKDSLLTLGVAQELGLKPEGVYINDTVSPIENKTKLSYLKKISSEFKIKIYFVRNEIEQLVDYETWGEDETMLSYNHMMTGFCFISLPVAHHLKTKYLILGNQQDMNFRFLNKDGILTYPSYDQTSWWITQQDLMIKMMTNDCVKVFSLIEPLTNIAIMKILHKRYKKLGKYEFSCDCVQGSGHERWCCQCNKCARLYIFMKAFGFNPKNVGYTRNLLRKKYKKYYILFDGEEIDIYEKSPEAKEQQLLAFYLAYKNGAKGELIDLFKKRFLEEAKAKEDTLIKKYLNIYKTHNIPRNLRQDLYSIYREELNY